jgi:tellurite methyltransferase
MPSSQSAWDAKHRLAAEAPPAEPAGIVRELLPLLPVGNSLDLACGAGRHSLLVAARGQHVTAVDWSGAALEILETQARATQVPVRRIPSLGAAERSSRSGISLMQANLEQIVLPERSYDLILCIRYLQKSLFPQICRALRPGGFLLFETYTQAQLEFEGGPRHPDHLLEAGELRKAFPKLCVFFYRELRASQGIASLAAQKPGRDD